MGSVVGTPELRSFWRWFRAEEPALGTLTTESLADAVYGRLGQIDAGVGVLVADDATPIELVFTAHAVAELASLVRELVAEAPELPGWRFVAFVPPATCPFTHERPGSRVDSAAVRFLPLGASGLPTSTGIRLFVPDDVLEPPEREEILWSLIITAAGEELAMYIEHVEGRALAQAADDELPLSQLGRYLSWNRARSSQ
ncbi:hypothetical protein JYT86_00585 [bacterium AH-315-N03]|nr:hypothetical protein [bacterium AH-315-N03]